MAKVCVPSAPDTATCQLLSVFSKDGVPRKNSRRAGSQQGERGESAAGLGQQTSPGGTARRPARPVLLLRLPLSQRASVCMGFAPPPYLCPLISVCFSDLSPLCRPKLQVLSCSFVLVTTLSWPPPLTVNTAQTQNERERMLRKEEKWTFFFKEQGSCLTCIGQP